MSIDRSLSSVSKALKELDDCGRAMEVDNWALALQSAEMLADFLDKLLIEQEGDE